MNFKTLIPNREWVGLALLAFAVTPFWRGGRDGIGYLVVSLLVFLAWFVWHRQAKKQKRIEPYVMIPLTLLATWLILSVTWAGDTFHAYLKGISLIIAVLVFLLARQLLDKPKNRKRLTGLMIYGSVPVVGYGFYLYLVNIYDRAASFFYAPNAYAIYLLVVWVLLLKSYKDKRSFYSLALMVLISSQFFLAGSVATGAIAVAATVASVFVAKFNKKQLIYIVAAIATGLFVSFAATDIKSRYGGGNIGTPDVASELVSAKVGGLKERFEYWEGAVEIFKDNPIIGVGADNFQAEYPQYQETPQLRVENPHNFYLQTLAESGVVGMFLLAALVIGLFMHAKRGSRKPETSFYLIALIAIALHAGFYQTYRYPALVYLFVVLLAMYLVADSKMSKAALPKYFNTAALFVSLLVLVPAGVHFRADNFSDIGFDFYDSRSLVRAEEYLTSSAKLPLSNPDVKQNLAIQFALGGRGDEAVEIIDQAIAEDSKDGNHYGAKAFALQNSGANRNVVYSYYEKALELEPLNSTDIYLNYVRYLFEQGEIDRAEELLDFIIPFYNDDIIARRSGLGDIAKRVGLLQFQRARIYASKGEAESLRSDLERVVRLYPEYGLAQSLLDELNEFESTQ